VNGDFFGTWEQLWLMLFLVPLMIDIGDLNQGSLDENRSSSLTTAAISVITKYCHSIKNCDLLRNSCVL